MCRLEWKIRSRGKVKQGLMFSGISARFMRGAESLSEITAMAGNSGFFRFSVSLLSLYQHDYDQPPTPKKTKTKKQQQNYLNKVNIFGRFVLFCLKVNMVLVQNVSSILFINCLTFPNSLFMKAKIGNV